MEVNLCLSEFLDLKSMECGSEDDASVLELNLCTQSIYHLIQYCDYHYVNLCDVVNESNLEWDRISVYRRAGETVPLRFVYEANIIAFIHSLHTLLDSFPHLLNLFVPVKSELNKNQIRWSKEFIGNYQSYCFYNQLVEFIVDDNFNKIKGYINTVKHKYVIRVINNSSHLEFENFIYEKHYLGDQGAINKRNENAKIENVIEFIEKCHNELIGKLFKLYNSILNCKRKSLLGN